MNLDWRKGLIEAIYNFGLEEEIELVVGLHAEGESFRSGILKASYTSDLGFVANLSNVVQNATGTYVLILGQDDEISITDLLSLLEEIRCLRDHNGNEKRDLPSIMCHLDYKGKKPSAFSSRQDIFMRLGGSPGVCIPNLGAILEDIGDYKQFFPDGIYPQVWLGMCAYERGGVVFSEARVEVGPAPTVAESMHDHWMRPLDYGARERIRIASILEKRSKRKSCLSWRLSRMRLLIWASSVYRRLEEVGEGRALDRVEAGLANELLIYEKFLMFGLVKLPRRIANRILF